MAEQSRRDFTLRALGLGLGAAALGPLAACNGSADGDTADVDLSDDAAVKGGPKTTPNPDVIYPDGYVGPIAADKEPIVRVGEQVRLRVVVPQNPSVGDWTKNEFSKWYEERTGVRVDYHVIAGEDDAMTKVNAMLASGDLPDVFMSVGFTTAQLRLYGDQGLFVPLNQLIDDYGVEIKQLLKDYPDTESAITSTDGKIYTLPYVNDCYHCSSGNRLWIYQPWLDELGLAMPESVDEFEEVLRAFKTGDPNKNGTADEIPLISSKDTSFDSYFMGSFMYNPGTPWLVLDDGNVDVTFDKPEWREGLRYLRRLYDQGLIADESFTQSTEQLLRLGDKKGDVVLGAVRAFYWGEFMTIDDDDPKARFRDYVAVPTLKGPDGTRTASWDYYSKIAAGNYVITSACENPAGALMWADGQYELEARMRNVYGLPERNWRWAEQGEIGIDGRQAVWSTVGTWPPPNGDWWAQLGLTYGSNDVRLGEVVDPKQPTFEDLLYQNTKRAYHPYREQKDQQLPPLYMTEEQAASTGELAVTIQNHVTQSFAKFVTGQLDVNSDAVWKEYVETVANMGLADYLAAHQEAYESKYQ